MVSDLVYVGVTHHNAPLGVRERCVVGPECLSGRLSHLHGVCEASVVLSTCGRLELYAHRRTSDPGLWRGRFARLTDNPVDVLNPYVEFKQGAAVARHLLRVAAGLESQILGDEHVLSQVREAFERTRTRQRCGPILSAAFQSALRTGKRVRHETLINRIPRSFARLAVACIERRAGRSALDHILILGSGRMAQDVAAALRKKTTTPMTVAGRDASRAALLAAEINGRCISLEAVPGALSRVSTVFGCTSSMNYLIRACDVTPRRHPLHMIDLGLPRNFDPRLAGRPGVHLLHLDDLAPNAGRRTATVAGAEEIVEQEYQRLLQWYRSRHIAPEVRDLLRRAEDMAPQRARRYKQHVHRRIQRLRAEVRL